MRISADTGMAARPGDANAIFETFMAGHLPAGSRRSTARSANSRKPRRGGEEGPTTRYSEDDPLMTPLMSKRSDPRAEQLRRALAQEAARIMAEQGIDDFLLAKRKAAERFGVTDMRGAAEEHRDRGGAGRVPAPVRGAHALPTPELAAPDGAAGDAAAAAIRAAAGRPRAQRHGTEHSEVQLHLFAERAEPVAMQLMERGIPHEVVERRVRYERGARASPIRACDSSSATSRSRRRCFRSMASARRR